MTATVDSARPPSDDSWLRGLSLLLRLGIGAILLYAGLSKIGDPRGFIESIANYRLLPRQWVPFAAITMPWLEVVSGFGLLIGLATRANGLIASAMMLGFVVFVSYALSKGINVDCGCFGNGGAKLPANPISGWTVLRNASLSLAAIAVVLLPTSRYSLDRLIGRN